MFGNRFDNELGSKIEDLLAKSKLAQTRVDEFLREELHVDPDALPLSQKQARGKLNNIFGFAYHNYTIFEGNSLGFKGAFIYEVDCNNCPACGAAAIEFDLPQELTEIPPPFPFRCLDCQHSWNQEAEFQENLTNQIKESNKNDLNRIYAALVASLPLHNSRRITPYSFLITDDPYDYEIPIIPKIEPDIKWYGPGMTLRLARHIISESGNSTEFVYAKVGNLYSDTQVCILPSMEPIPNLPDWHVVEVL